EQNVITQRAERLALSSSGQIAPTEIGDDSEPGSLGKYRGCTHGDRGCQSLVPLMPDGKGRATRAEDSLPANAGTIGQPPAGIGQKLAQRQMGSAYLPHIDSSQCRQGVQQLP